MIKQKIVNVASVPQRSPFRYPGGKTWLVPFIRAWMRSRSKKSKQFVEPFAGGGIVSLTVAFENLAEHILMVELDADVAAVWKAIFGGDASWLAERIMKFDVTMDSVKGELVSPANTLRQRAFRTLLRNRVLHGGILAPGSSLIKHGEAGKGIRSRWYPSTLKNRILAISEVENKIEFVEGDGMAVMERNLNDGEAAFFIDPPYTAAGKKAGTRLYRHHELDHEKLFELTASVQGDFLMTYDNAAGVLKMAERYGFDTESVAMKNTHHAEMTELLIGRDLAWVRNMKRRSEGTGLLFE